MFAGNSLARCSSRYSASFRSIGLGKERIIFATISSRSNLSSWIRCLFLSIKIILPGQISPAKEVSQELKLGMLLPLLQA